MRKLAVLIHLTLFLFIKPNKEMKIQYEPEVSLSLRQLPLFLCLPWGNPNDQYLGQTPSL